MILQVGVKALLKNKDGKYLIVKRSIEKYKDTKGEWDIPGGRIDPETPLIANLKREIKEETGLVLATDPKIIYAQDIFTKDGEKHVVRLTFLGEIEGIPVLDDENTDFAWLTLDELVAHKELDPFLRTALDSQSFT